MADKPLTKTLKIENLHTHFFSSQGVAKAVDGVSYELEKGKVIGVVGESGCGKSVTAQSVMRIVPSPPGRIVKGRILFDGQNLVDLSMKQMRSIRGARIAMIFQEPMSSLNPVFTIGDQLSEMFILHKGMGKKEALDAAIEKLKQVHIPEAHRRVKDYPHQLSGGMCQRIMIAMALSCDPEVLIADEPTTALDVTVQSQILDLIMELKENHDTAVQLITHDLGVIAETADKVVVMYAGRVVEQAGTLELFDAPLHPYTRGLLKSTPKLGMRTSGKNEVLAEMKGMVPSLFNLPKGCKFYDRCPDAMPVCGEKEPELTAGPTNGSHAVRCWIHSP